MENLGSILKYSVLLLFKFLFYFINVTSIWKLVFVRKGCIFSSFKTNIILKLIIALILEYRKQSLKIQLIIFANFESKK